MPLNNPNAIASIISPATNIPDIIAIMVFLKSSFRMLAAKVPVQAPVPGIGIATNKNKAKKVP